METISTHSIYGHKNMVFNSPLWKGVISIGIGTAIAQVISIGLMPIITRLYAPSDFGLLGIFSSIITIMMATMSLRYEFAIPIPKNSSKAAHLLILCLIILAITTSLFATILLLTGDMVLGLVDAVDLRPYLWLVVIGFIGSGIYQILNYWSIRQQDYPRITRTKISQGLGGTLSKLIFGFLSFGPSGLILGQIISYVSGTYTFLKAIILKDRDNFKNISLVEIKSVSHEFQSFPLYSAPASIIYSASLQIPVFALSIFYDLNVVGLYSLAYQMLALPAGLIAGSMAQVFYGEAAKAVREKSEGLKSLYKDTTRKLALIGIPSIGVIALVAPWVFPIVFGGAWRDAGVLCIPLALVAMSDFVVNPTNKLGVYGFNRWQFIYHIFRFILVVIGFIVASYLHLNVLATLTVYSLIVMSTYVILYYMNLRAIDTISK